MIGELSALGAALSWAIAPVLYQTALGNIKPISANIVRCITNGAVLLILFFSLGLGGWLFSLPLWAVIVTIVSGVVGLGVGDTLYMMSLKSIGVSRAVPLASTYPLFGLIWAVFLVKQSLSLAEIVGAIVIVIGIWLLSRKHSIKMTNVAKKTLLSGVAASLVTAAIWSISLSLMGYVITCGITSLDGNFALVTIRIASLGFLFAIFSPIIDKEHGFLKVSKKIILLLCVGGLVANGLGWFLMNYSFLLIPQAQALPISSTSPLFATFAGFALFREKATAWSILGTIAVVAGIMLIFII